MKITSPSHKVNSVGNSPFFFFLYKCLFLLFCHFSSRWIWRRGDGETAYQGGGRGGGHAKLGGGWELSSLTRGGSQGVTGRGKFIPLSSIPPFSLLLNLALNFPLQSGILSSLSLSFLSGIWVTTAGQPAAGRGTKTWREGTATGDRRVGEDEGSGGRIRGRRSLWALEGSCIVLLPCPISTSSKEASFCLQYHHLPTTPSGVHRTWSLWTCRSGHWTYLFSCSPSFRGGHSGPHATL